MNLVDPADVPADTTCPLCGFAGGVYVETVFKPGKATCSTHHYCSACDHSWKVIKRSDSSPVKRELRILH